MIGVGSLISYHDDNSSAIGLIVPDGDKVGIIFWADVGIVSHNAQSLEEFQSWVDQDEESNQYRLVCE